MKHLASAGSASVNGRLWGSRALEWADLQEGFSLPVYDSVFDMAALGPRDQYADLGCGAGLAATIAALRGPRVTGLDASERLLSIARRRVPSGDFHCGELEDLPFPEDSFTVVTAFNSLQYAAHPDVALKEARRVARPGARLVIVTWATPEGMEWAALLEALRSVAPPPPGAPGPFALSEEARLCAFAAEAGLTTLNVWDVDVPVAYADLETALRSLTCSGNAARAIERASEESLRHAYAESLKPFRQPDGSYRIGSRYRCLLAAA
jgi:SAM-dependent methyltransferase